jgi:hypothetical protein
MASLHLPFPLPILIDEVKSNTNKAISISEELLHFKTLYIVNQLIHNISVKYSKYHLHFTARKQNWCCHTCASSLFLAHLQIPCVGFWVNYRPSGIFVFRSKRNEEEKTDVKKQLWLNSVNSKEVQVPASLSATHMKMRLTLQSV